jgi:hypothetical protein
MSTFVYSKCRHLTTYATFTERVKVQPGRVISKNGPAGQDYILKLSEKGATFGVAYSPALSCYFQ